MARIRWVQQDTYTGCATACFAMLTGRTYADVAADLKSMHQGGLTTKQIDAYLFEQGFFIRRFYKNNWVADESRPAWPVMPARICIADVVNDPENSNTHVVVVVDGVVFDPGDVNKRRLDEYSRVISVTGVYKPQQRKSKKEANEPKD